jgi:dihydropteroate synthase
MTEYFRPIAQTDSNRSDSAFALAGGWCWFDRVEVLSRNGAPKIIDARELDRDALDRLAKPRAAIASMDMSQPQIMGILNVTPDSFSDGGQHDAAGDAVARALQMQADGAKIIDVGGESTRPGAVNIAIEQEIERVVPPIRGLRERSAVAISRDTRKSAVADAAIAAGANLINDVSAFMYDSALGQKTAESGLPVCLMHAQGNPQDMQDDPRYDHVLMDVYDFLAERVTHAVSLGIARENIIVDPGIGFGKTQKHNLTLLNGLSLFHSLGCPILLGASRKKFIGTIGNAPDAADRVAGSVSVALHGVNQGVQILRVHDTFATKQAIDLQMAMIRTSGNGT